MKVSIIVPVYNAEKYLRACLDSLVGQTWKDIEIILVNDGSTDGSAEICQAYCSDPRVIYRYQANAGVSAARNAGLDQATGEYICFVDSDDWLELDALERLQGETADIVMYNFYHGEKKHHEPLADGIYPNEALFPNMISYIDEEGNIAYQFHTIWMRLFKRRLIEDNQIRFNLRYCNGEDLLFTFAATLKAETVSLRCSEYLYHYRPVANSQTTSYIVNYWPLRKQIIGEMYALMESNILRIQMPLRIFSWAVTGIENELRFSRKPKKIVRSIVQDPFCDYFKGRIETSGLDIQNQRYYEQICNGDYKGILRDYRREKRKAKWRKRKKKIKNAIRALLLLRVFF